MALDEQSKILLEQIKSLNAPAVNTIAPAKSRELVEARPRLEGPELTHVRDLTINIEGNDISCRLYLPSSDSKLPILVWFHGGGWVIGSVDVSDGVTRYLADKSGYAVLSVDYRLSPEVKFPGPLNDCYGVTKWVYENSDELNVDNTKISVGGDSAGGNLASAVCLKAKDEGNLPILSQLLIYPCVDSDFNRKSFLENKDDYLLSATAMKWFWQQYVNSESDLDNHYVCPLKYNDHSNLPQACIIVAEHDPLLDEGIDYHQKLLNSKVNSQLIEYSGVMHGFYSQIGVLDKAADAMNASAKFLKSVVL